VDLGKKLRLRGRGLDTALQGDLKLTTPGGRLAVNGTVRTQGGTYAAYGQKLTIERGIVSFSGRVDSPRLDILALRPNTGVPTGRDLDRNGQLGEPRDAQGWGRFAGEGGIAVLSRLPIGQDIRDFSGFLWADLPGNLMPEDDPARDLQRLHTTGAYEVPIELKGGKSLRLLVFYASPPVFDGPEDRNGRRNHDEAAFWLRLLEGGLPMPPPDRPFVILGQTSLDPMDGEGRPQALRGLLAHPALQDPQPRGDHGRVDPGQAGDAALDTALYDGLGGLRVSVILPSADLMVRDAAVLWPPDSDPMAATRAAASRHSPIWVDLALP
jgi:hypothetical protein